jgi:hypothetical protein
MASFTRFKKNICSDYSSLNQLHETHEWIPNEQQIRPKKNKLMMKQEKLAMIGLQWKSLRDYIKNYVWGLDRKVEDDGKFSVAAEPSGCVFQQCEFHYDLQDGKHFVLWFPEQVQTQDNASITSLLDSYIASTFHVDSQDFDFAWYVNPKMTVPEFFHVQVFINVSSIPTAALYSSLPVSEASDRPVALPSKGATEV